MGIIEDLGNYGLKGTINLKKLQAETWITRKLAETGVYKALNNLGLYPVTERIDTEKDQKDDF